MSKSRRRSTEWARTEAKDTSPSPHTIVRSMEADAKGRRSRWYVITESCQWLVVKKTPHIPKSGICGPRADGRGGLRDSGLGGCLPSVETLGLDMPSLRDGLVWTG